MSGVDPSTVLVRHDVTNPSIGDVVLYTHAPGYAPAGEPSVLVGIIGEVTSHTPPMAHILTFPPFKAPKWEGSVPEGIGPRTWAYPPTTTPAEVTDVRS